MKPKEKPCKGTTEHTKGYGCGKLTFHRVYGLGKMCCYPDWLLNTEQGRIKLEKAKIKASKPRLELQQAKLLKKSKSTLETLKKNVTNDLHAYVRLRDKGKPCISCSVAWRPDFQAGHFKPANKFSSLKYNLDNINSQCIGCNIWNEGNVEMYEINLRKRIGDERVDEINRIAAKEVKIGHIDWDREKLKEIQKKAKLLIKKLNQ